MPINKKCMEYTNDDLFPVGLYPSKLTRWSPKKRTMRYLLTFINDRLSPNDSILEFGCGPSSWWLSHLTFKTHTAVETYEPAIDVVHKHCPHVSVIDKWVDIPKMKYKWIFVDSKVGGDAEGAWARYKPLTYAYENGLVGDDTIMIVHDYNRILQSQTHRLWAKRHSNWNNTIKEQNWKLIDEILVSRCFGIYGR